MGRRITAMTLLILSLVLAGLAYLAFLVAFIRTDGRPGAFRVFASFREPPRSHLA